MNKKILSMFAICLILAIAISAVKVDALTTGTSTGTATVGAATPTVTDSGLFDSGDTTSKDGAALTVDTEYHFNCTVGDANGLYSLLNITFYVYETGFVAWNAADHNQTHYTFMYLNSSDAYSEVGPGPSNTHLVSANCVKPTRTGTSSAVKLAFKLAKTANYTSSASWKVNVTVFASNSLYANQQTITFSVSAYYEIVVADATHGWTGLSPGDNNVTLTSPAAGYITIYCTSNHYQYGVKVQSESASLTDATADTISIGHILDGQIGGLVSATNLTTSYANVPGYSVVNPAGDGLNTALYISLWISVPAGQPSGSYTYVLDIEIVSVP
jgi:hypothetical protein